MTRTDLVCEMMLDCNEGDGCIENKPLLPPNLLKLDAPLTAPSRQTVLRGRREAASILNLESDRLLVVVGPCSIHDPSEALEYASRLSKLSASLASELCIVMRAYLEKPRTTVGWKGLINDPHLDGSFDINAGLRLGRELYCGITAMGLPVATELLDTISPAYLADLISVGAIGARTTESALHREMASGVGVPVGFKNSTDGNVSVALDAVRSAASSHHYIGVSEYGRSSICATRGNQDCFVILRGGSKGPNYDSRAVGEVLGKLEAAGRKAAVMVDCSHGNSNKDYRKQPKVVGNIAARLRGGEEGIVGVMIESNLCEGKQNVPAAGAAAGLKRGVSITDGCIGWEDTILALEDLASAVRSRRMAVRTV